MPDPLASGTLAAFKEARDLFDGTLFDWLTQVNERDEVELGTPPADCLRAKSKGTPAG